MLGEKLRKKRYVYMSESQLNIVLRRANQDKSTDNELQLLQ